MALPSHEGHTIIDHTRYVLDLSNRVVQDFYNSLEMTEQSSRQKSTKHNTRTPRAAQATLFNHIVMLPVDDNLQKVYTCDKNPRHQ